MINAIIAVSSVAGFGLILFFLNYFIDPFGMRGNKKDKNENAPKRKRTGKDVKQWFINHAPSKRRLIQVYTALLYNANIKGFVSGKIYKGENTKYMCVPGLNCYSCPGAVGACPLGALQNGLAESNTRAPYYILGILALFGLMFARTVCGFLCPIGMCQELLYKVRTPKLKKSRVTRVLSYFKYVLLALAIALPLIYSAVNIPLPAFCKYICPAGTFGGAMMLLIHPANSQMFAQLGWQFTWKFSLLVAFVVASIFIFRFFCRFFCPLGAIYGFFNRFALIGVEVDRSSCTDCGLCVRHCKMDVKKVSDHECINCGECISVCPAKAISWKGSKLFLHASSRFEPAPEVKPLAVGADGSVVIAAKNENAPRDRADNAASADVAATADGTVATEKASSGVEVVDKQNVKPKKRPVKFWLEVSAWAAALAVLIGALVFYNFVDKEKPYVPPAPPQTGEETETGYEVGDIAPDFTVRLYRRDGEFNLYANRGRVTVVNFWATWCTPCVEEIPYFNELAENYPELTVVAVHGSSTRDVDSFISDKGWGGYTLMFAQDDLDGTHCLTFEAMGGTSMWPMTVIIDGDGKVIYNSTTSFRDYAQLDALVGGLLAQQE